MWWPRLFIHHASSIAWDDYEKDYSDLPAHIRQVHAVQQAKDEEQRQTEAAEKMCRDKLQVISINGCSLLLCCIAR